MDQVARGGADLLGSSAAGHLGAGGIGSTVQGEEYLSTMTMCFAKLLKGPFSQIPGNQGPPDPRKASCMVIKSQAKHRRV